MITVTGKANRLRQRSETPTIDLVLQETTVNYSVHHTVKFYCTVAHNTRPVDVMPRDPAAFPSACPSIEMT